jgi:hypothetical protein
MPLAHALSVEGQSLELRRRQEDYMTFAIKKQATPQQGAQIHVDRNVVISASRQTSITINQMTDQIVREVAKELEKKHDKS